MFNFRLWNPSNSERKLWIKTMKIRTYPSCTKLFKHTIQIKTTEIRINLLRAYINLLIYNKILFYFIWSAFYIMKIKLSSELLYVYSYVLYVHIKRKTRGRDFRTILQRSFSNLIYVVYFSLLTTTFGRLFIKKINIFTKDLRNQSNILSFYIITKSKEKYSISILGKI